MQVSVLNVFLLPSYFWLKSRQNEYILCCTLKKVGICSAIFGVIPFIPADKEHVNVFMYMDLGI